MRDTTTTRPAIQGAAPLARIRTLLAQLHDDGTARDRAGNRQLFYDQYVGLLLLDFFNPALSSLNALRQATELDSVQRWLGLPKRISVGSLSEAAGVFDPDLLRGLLADLARQVAPSARPDDRDALRHLTAVDGTLLPVLPRLAHTLWGDAGRLSAKLHLHFEVGRGIPIDATVTPAASSEIAQLQGALQAGRLYVTDRGYASYRLLADILAAGSSFVARLRGDAAYRGAERDVTAAARAAGVVRDVTVDRLGVGADVLGRAVRWWSFSRNRAMGGPTPRSSSSPTGSTCRPNWSPWRTAGGGRSNCSSAGSSASSAAATCCPTTWTGSPSRCTWRSSPACCWGPQAAARRPSGRTRCSATS